MYHISLHCTFSSPSLMMPAETVSCTAAGSKIQDSNVVMPTTKLNDKFEVSIFRAPKILMRELDHVFSCLSNSASGPVLAVLTCQHSDTDLVKYGDEVDVEKDRLLEDFVEFAKEYCDRLINLGHWADYIDPCSGLAMIDSNPNRVYSEVDGMQLLLKYKVMNAGCCKILLHPQWGSSVYPASLFTTAPEEAARSVMLSLMEEKR